MSGEVAEHDYATFIIENALEPGGNQVVIAMEELTSGDLLQFQTSSSEALDQVIDDTYEDEQHIETVPSYRSEAARGTSGYWSEADVHRLLRVYLKHMRAYPNLKGRPMNFVWEKIAKDFDKKNRYTRHQIKTKILRLRNSAKAFLGSGEEQGTKWPFMKQVLEILKLEGDGLASPSNNGERGTQPWRSEEIQELLELYKKFSRGNPSTARRFVFAKVAKELNRQKFDVQLKFQSLKAAWRRSVEGHMHNSWPYFNLMQEIMNEDQKKSESKKEKTKAKNGKAPKNDESARPRWEKEQTLLLLKIYKEKLEEIKSSKEVVTRVQLYRSVAQQMELSLESVQIKMSSLRTHWNKYGKLHSNKWQFHPQMRQIHKLENVIWFNGDDESDVEPDNEVVLKVGKAASSDVAEPLWVKHYRKEAQRRHEESMEIRFRILEALEQLVHSDNRSQDDLEDVLDDEL